MLGIFICYRRSDTAAYAGRLHDRLAAQFGPAAVFLDTGDIEPGSEFMRVIEARISSCSAFLAVIGEMWLSGAKGSRRLEQADDLVRREIEIAIQHCVPIIPVVVGDAAMPDRRELPESIQSLADRSALHVTHDLFDESLAKLINTISPKKPSLQSTWLPALTTTVLAFLGTFGTVLFFNSSSITNSAPIGPMETVVISVFWLIVSVSARWLVLKMSKRPQPK